MREKSRKQPCFISVTRVFQVAALAAALAVALSACGSSGVGGGLITQSWVQNATGGSFSNDAAQVNLDPARGDCTAYNQFASDLASASSGSSGTAQVAWYNDDGAYSEYITEAIIPTDSGTAQNVLSDAQSASHACALQAFSGGSQTTIATAAGNFTADDVTGYALTMESGTGRTVYETVSMAYTGTDLIVARDIQYSGGTAPAVSEDAVSYSVAHT